jgi:hypothetical protein
MGTGPRADHLCSFTGTEIYPFLCVGI